MSFSIDDKVKLLSYLMGEINQMILKEKNSIVVERLEHLIVVANNLIETLKNGEDDGSIL